MHQGIVRIVCICGKLYGDVWIHLVKVSQVLAPLLSVVVLRFQVSSVVKQADGCR